MKSKPLSIEFNCSFCGHTWTAKASDFKQEEIKGNRYIWAKYTTKCPKCGLDSSVVQTIKDNSEKEISFYGI